jgi:transcriptional regulator with XRE-family HTH domain
MTNVDLANKAKHLSDLAKRIREARRTARLSQDALGKSIGVSDKSISAYEQGRSIPPINKLKQIAKFTEHPFSYFTQEDPDEGTLTAKLLSIERELNEVKRLLRAKK